MNKQKHIIHTAIKLLVLTVLLVSTYLIGKQSNNIILTNPINNQIIEDTKQSLIVRCGDIPDNVGNEPAPLSPVVGLSWSPDCRHIAWSVSGLAVGIGLPGETSKIQTNPWEGAYIYTDATKRTAKIHVKGVLDKDIVVKAWKDRNSLVLYISPDKPLVVYDINKGILINE